MAGALIGGAALGAPFSALQSFVFQELEVTIKFSSSLEKLKSTLTRIKPVIDRLVMLDQGLGRVEKNAVVENMVAVLNRGLKLVKRCSRVRCWHIWDRRNYGHDLEELDKSLIRVFTVDAPVEILGDVKESLTVVKEIRSIVLGGGTLESDQIPWVPGPPEHVVGFEQPLKHVKAMVLRKDNASVVAITAPGGSGKSTLAKLLCHDPEIREDFKNNIFYAMVSDKPNLKTIACKLIKDMRSGNQEFQTDEDAILELEKSVRRKIGGGSLLLVLDDLWHEAIVDKLKFSIPGFKILFTSRSRFPKYKENTYKLNLLNDQDSMKLFRTLAFRQGDENMVSNNIVSKIVKDCKGFPLALKVAAGALDGQPREVWWERYNSNLENDLLDSLQLSLDALDKLPNSVKDCYLGLELFPKGERITVTSLTDMWAHLYNIDEKKSLINLHILHQRNLLDLVTTRKDNFISESEFSSDEHYVTQHDVLRELVIRQVEREPIQERERINLDISSFSNLSSDKLLNARLISISSAADEASSSSSSFQDLGKEMSSCFLKLPKVEALLLNIRSSNYCFPQFMKGMAQPKVLIVTNHGVKAIELQNLQLPCGFSNLRRVRLEFVSISCFDTLFSEMKNLQKIALSMCKIGMALSDFTNKTPTAELTKLREIEIDCCSDLTTLSSGLCDFPQLAKLRITNCHELTALPEELGNLRNLEVLTVYSCTKLSKLPDSIGDLCRLKFLDISECLAIEVLPERMGELSSLRMLNMRGCTGLHTLPASFKDLDQLKEVICDEEISCVWKNFDGELTMEKVKVVKRVSSLEWLHR